MKKEDLVKQLADKLAEIIAAEMEAEHRAALLIHEEDIEVFIKLREIVHRRNPIDRQYLDAVRQGMDLLWDHSKVLSGRDMDFLARALDIAQQQDNWKEESAKHALANAY